MPIGGRDHEAGVNGDCAARCGDDFTGSGADRPLRRHLERQYGTKDKPSSLTLTGQIQVDDSAPLRASGLNGKSDYTAGFGQPGEKFSYPVEARFEAKRGAGIRTQTRTCRFTFAKH